MCDCNHKEYSGTFCSLGVQVSQRLCNPASCGVLACENSPAGTGVRIAFAAGLAM